MNFCVRMKGLEPPRLSAPDPKSGAATNYATSAFEGAKLQNITIWQMLFLAVKANIFLKRKKCLLYEYLDSATGNCNFTE